MHLFNIVTTADVNQIILWRNLGFLIFYPIKIEDYNALYCSPEAEAKTNEAENWYTL